MQHCNRAHFACRQSVTLRRIALWGFAMTLSLRVQGGQGSIQQTLGSALESVSGALASVGFMNGVNSAAYAVGAVGAACAAFTAWTQLSDKAVLTVAGQEWLGQMVSATYVFAVIVLLVLKVLSRK